MKRTGGPGERVDLSYLQDSAGGGGRRGWAARKLLKERGIGIFRKLSPDSSWEADSGRFLGCSELNGHARLALRPGLAVALARWPLHSLRHALSAG